MKSMEQSSCSRHCLIEDVVWQEDTDQDKHFKMFNFIYICRCAGSVWSTTIWTWVNAAIAIIFSSQCFWPTKTPSCVTKHLKQAFCSILFTHNHLMKCLSSMANPIAATTLLLMFTLHCCQLTMFNKSINHFRCKESASSQLYHLKFSIQIGQFFQELYKKTKGTIFLNTTVAQKMRHHR